MASSPKNKQNYLNFVVADGNDGSLFDLTSLAVAGLRLKYEKWFCENKVQVARSGLFITLYFIIQCYDKPKSCQ